MKEHESWNQKLKAFLVALEIENIDHLMKDGNIESYTKLGVQMTKVVRNHMRVAQQSVEQVQELLVIVKGLEKDLAIEMGDNVDDQD